MKSALIIGFVLAIALWFWAIIDIAKSRFINSTMNTVWLLIVLFFPILGSFFYFILREKYITNQSRKFQPKFNKKE
ncbi:MAG: PLD nuclease N-terminal domain-containing protein [Brumimicrobium sp.]|nr:PLD nuclease N-terminal domain-containing protein [Brumimicrobium sp.]